MKCAHCDTSLNGKYAGFVAEDDRTMHPPTRCLEIVKQQRDTARAAAQVATAALTAANETIAQLKKDILLASHIQPRRTKAQKGLYCSKCRRALQEGEDIFGDVLHIHSRHVFTATFMGWCLDCSARYGFREES